MAASPIPAEHPLVASWHAGVASLDRANCRVPGMLGAKRYPSFESDWSDVCGAMEVFLADWGAAAAALGWTSEQLFGVHRQAGAYRADSTGALVTLRPKRVVAIDAATIVLDRRGSRQSFRGLSNPAESVPVWDFSARAVWPKYLPT